jgi:hypothetical protein
VLGITAFSANAPFLESTRFFGVYFTSDALDGKRVLKEKNQ